VNKKKFLLVIFILLFGMGGYRAGGMVHFAFFPYQTSPENQETISIPRGLSPYELSQQLQKKKLISSARRFYWLGKALGHWPKMKAGDYEISSSQSPLEIFALIQTGLSKNYPVTFQEGKNRYQFAEILESKGLGKKENYLTLCKDKSFLNSMDLPKETPSCEGYLFPETYQFPKSLSEKQILITLISRFKKNWTLEFQQRAQQIKMTQHQIITLASIVEKETGASEERPLISSVFHNRLKKKMRLQSDPTTIYGIWENFNGNLQKKHLFEKNNYNTYKIKGLPIGPIANPGLKAIEAALYPATSSYLYFVSKNDGTHYFSKTITEHNQAVRKYQLNSKAREGKSWRDLHQR
tara:strand:+ start:1122 stop:2177 length:1056 start_codon:yes stop_codon:yes gene_type:complete